MDEKKQVNVEMNESLVKFLDELVDEDQSNRSSVIRKLILREQGRRQQLELPLPIGKSKTKKNRQEQAAVAA